eukprot:115060-Chlamydomonas_euryale.AAC.2
MLRTATCCWVGRRRALTLLRASVACCAPLLHVARLCCMLRASVACARRSAHLLECADPVAPLPHALALLHSIPLVRSPCCRSIPLVRSR